MALPFSTGLNWNKGAGAGIAVVASDVDVARAALRAGGSRALNSGADAVVSAVLTDGNENGVGDAARALLCGVGNLKGDSGTDAADLSTPARPNRGAGATFSVSGTLNNGKAGGGVAEDAPKLKGADGFAGAVAGAPKPNGGAEVWAGVDGEAPKLNIGAEGCAGVAIDEPKFKEGAEDVWAVIAADDVPKLKIGAVEV